MGSEFQAVANPVESLCREVASLAPQNPYYTYEYIYAKTAVGVEPWLLIVREGGEVTSGCPAFLKKDFLNRSLEIESLPQLPEADLFWRELQEFCRKTGISDLSVNSLASSTATIPAMSGELERKERHEFVMELKDTDLWKALRRNHRRNINKSREAGVTISAAVGDEAWHEHTRAVKDSVDRRKARGEVFVEVTQTELFSALTRNGKTELYQAKLGEEVLSSAYITKAEKGAYYFWAGTTREGTGLGASHCLVFEIACRLQREGLEVFNLGGTGLENKGLVEFKSGFGTKQIPLESAEFCFGNRLKRKLGRAVQLLKDDPRHFLKRAREQFAQASA